MKRSFFPTRLASLVLVIFGFQASALASASDERQAWVPKSKHGEARTLVDPGPQGLLGKYKLLTLKLPEFIATYQGSEGKLVIHVHPPNKKSSPSANWTGKRVALTVRATTLEREALEKALAAVIEIVQKREQRWGWLWRPVVKKVTSKAPFSGFYRPFAYGEKDDLQSRLRTLQGDRSVELVVMLDGLELAYRLGHQSFARVLAGQLARNSEEKLAKGEQTPSVLQANRLLLARAFALAGRTDQLEKIQGGILGSVSICRAAVVARALHAAGRKVDAMEFVEGKILGRTNTCAPALDLAVELRLHNDDLEGAIELLKLYKGRLTNHPATFLARARVKLAAGEIDAGIDLLRTALRFNPREPQVYDLLASALLFKRKDVGSLTIAKKRREEKLKDLSAQIYAGFLCAAYEDNFCVAAAAESTRQLSRGKNSLPEAFLDVLQAFVTKDKVSLEENLTRLWAQGPFLLTPLVIEHLTQVLAEKPSMQVLTSYAELSYGPGLARQIKQLTAIPLPSAGSSEQGDGEPAVTPPSAVTQGGDAEKSEEAFPIPSGLFLTIGALLAFLGIVAVLRQRKNPDSSNEQE